MYNGKVTRIYYKNLFFHTGHIKTMLDNERFAKKHNGICYAIVDDRQDNGIKHIKDDFDYIGLKHIKVISVNAYYKDIMDYTRTLIKKGDINFGLSEIEKDSCKIYLIETELELREYDLKIENCAKSATILSIRVSD